MARQSFHCQYCKGENLITTNFTQKILRNVSTIMRSVRNPRELSKAVWGRNKDVWEAERVSNDNGSRMITLCSHGTTEDSVTVFGWQSAGAELERVGSKMVLRTQVS
jgi:hypothetical protein